ncbi:MAG TPA: fibronectin type III domain-containing protein [Gammaproteobacteria bacterium]
MNPICVIGVAVLVAVGLSGCGGGGGGSAATPVTTHSVTLSWQPNRDSGVNRPGGGYQVSISGQPTIIVPYASGPAAPTSTTVSLTTGSYTVTVRAFAALDSQGGNTGFLSASSAALTVKVP